MWRNLQRNCGFKITITTVRILQLLKYLTFNISKYIITIPRTENHFARRLMKLRTTETIELAKEIAQWSRIECNYFSIIYIYLNILHLILRNEFSPFHTLNYFTRRMIKLRNIQTLLLPKETVQWSRIECNYFSIIYIYLNILHLISRYMFSRFRVLRVISHED